MNTQNSPFFTNQEVSEFLGISISIINRLVKEGIFNEAEKYLYEKIIDKADEYFSLGKTQKITWHR